MIKYEIKCVECDQPEGECACAEGDGCDERTTIITCPFCKKDSRYSDYDESDFYCEHCESGLGEASCEEVDKFYERLAKTLSDRLQTEVNELAGLLREMLEVRNDLAWYDHTDMICEWCSKDDGSDDKPLKPNEVCTNPKCSAVRARKHPAVIDAETGGEGDG